MRAVEKIKWRERMELGWCGWASLWKWQGGREGNDRTSATQRLRGKVWQIVGCMQEAQSPAGGRARLVLQSGKLVGDQPKGFGSREEDCDSIFSPWRVVSSRMMFFGILEILKFEISTILQFSKTWKLICLLGRKWMEGEQEWRRWDHLGDHHESKREMTVMNLQMVRPSLTYLWRSYGNRSASYKGFDN